MGTRSDRGGCQSNDRDVVLEFQVLVYNLDARQGGRLLETTED